MHLESLKNLVQPHVDGAVEDLYHAFRSETGHQDLDRFLVYLQAQNKISTEAARKVLDASDVELSGPPDSDAGGGGVEAHGSNELLMMGLIGEGSMGRIHLAKDMVMGAEHFRMLFPRSADWLEVKARLDPDGLFSSNLFRRLFPEAAGDARGFAVEAS